MPEIDNKTLNDIYNFLTELLGEWSWKNNPEYEKFKDDFQNDYDRLEEITKKVRKLIND